MVKQLVSSSEKSNVQVQDTNQGCMWSILHILDYHHWHVKKVFAHKRRRHARYKSKTVVHNQGEEEKQYEVAEAGPAKGTQHSRNSRAADISSPKNLRKRPVTENRIKEENSAKNQVSGEYALQLEKDGNTTEVSLNQKRMETKINKLEKDISSKYKKQNDVMEVFRVEKDLLLKFLREFDFVGKNLHQSSHKKARLTKSGTFPLTSSSKMRSISRLSSLKHKQNEVWAFPKGEKLFGGAKATEISTSGVVSNVSYEKPMPLASDLGVDGAMKQKSGTSSRSSHGLNQRGWNQLVLHRFKVIKQKIKHALVEAIHHRASPDEHSITNNEKENSQSLHDGVIQEHLKNKSPNETRSTASASKRDELRLVRRTSSLNESLDKYTELFEKSFSTDVKWHSSKSKSLRLTNEDKTNKGGRVPKFSRSNFSLPNIDALGFILHEALLDMNDTTDKAEETDNHVQGEPVSLPLKKEESFGHAEETEIKETVEAGERDVNPSPQTGKVVENFDEIVTSEQKEDIQEMVVGDESFPQNKEEISMKTNPSNATSNEEGRESSKQGSSGDELKTELPNVVATAEDLTISKIPEIHSLLLKPNKDNESNFKYVKAILQLSGFMENDHAQLLHSTHQSLKPSLLQDASLSHEIESSDEEPIKSYEHHQQLLFDIVNEVLLEIQEVSPIYFPKPFSFNYRLHPMPRGNHLLNEVWRSVNSYLSLRPELDQTLDDVVGRDLAKTSGWMNLQQEEEYVALELEEMIMDDLIDEITFS